VDLFIRRGGLRTAWRFLWAGAFWLSALELLRDQKDETLARAAVSALGAARLYGQAGAVVLTRCRVPAALHSAAARRAVLRAYATQGGAAGGGMQELERELTALGSH